MVISGLISPLINYGLVWRAGVSSSLGSDHQRRRFTKARLGCYHWAPCALRGCTNKTRFVPFLGRKMRSSPKWPVLCRVRR